MRPSIGLAYTMSLLLPLNAAAVEVEVAQWPLEIDGYLSEWGGVLPVALVPGGPEIGVRGAFTGTEDHEADVLAQWDADFLYLAVAVSDDVIDIARIPPSHQVWTGDDGVRKDRMFYHDHLKIFVRESTANLGNNLWIAPKLDDGAPYAWGHRQRSPADEQPPVILAGELMDGVYTFEVALPWTWLEITPRAGSLLKSRILLVDADLPGVPIEDKIGREAEKWIWWTGVFQLAGELPRDEAAEAAAAAALAEEQRLQQAALVEEQMRLAAAARAQAVAESLAAVRQTERDSVAAEYEQEWEERHKKMQERPQPVVAARPAGPPEWLLAIPRSPELTDDQVYAYLRFLLSDGQRLIRKRISSRTDYAIVDLARAGGSLRSAARAFLLEMLAAIERDLSGPGGWARPPVVAAANRTGMAPESSVILVREIVAHIRKGLEKSRTPTTGDAIERAAKKAGVTSDQAHAFLDSLLSSP